MSLALIETQQAVAEHLSAIESHFKPGVKVTLLVRTPDHPDRDFLMTSDDLAEAQTALARRQAAGATG